MLAPRVVKYSRPEPGEEDLRFRLVEDNGDRVLIELICDLPIPPRECVAAAEVEADPAAAEFTAAAVQA